MIGSVYGARIYGGSLLRSDGIEELVDRGAFVVGLLVEVHGEPVFEKTRKKAESGGRAIGRREKDARQAGEPWAVSLRVKSAFNHAHPRKLSLLFRLRPQAQRVISTWRCI